jgi:hypothetical protein
MTEDVRVGDWNSLCGIVAVAKHFADRDYQKRIWVRAEGPHVESYFEATETLDDYRAEHFAEGGALTYGFTAEMLDSFRTFIRTLRTFERTAGSHFGGSGQRRTSKEIIELPAWNSVVEAAERFCESVAGWYSKQCEMQ